MENVSVYRRDLQDDEYAVSTCTGTYKPSPFSMGRMGRCVQEGGRADDPAPSSPDTGAPSIKIFETLDFIFIRVPVQEESMLTGLKIFHTSLQVMLKSFPKPDAEQVIRLPSPVRRKGTTAKYRDGILEIRLLKKVNMK